MPSEVYYGPTVYESAVAEERKLVGMINELQHRLSAARVRQRIYAYSSMLESERLATVAEPVQKRPLESEVAT